MQRRINVIGEDESVYTKTEDDWNQRRDEWKVENEDRFINEEDPSEAELIGALNRILLFRIAISVGIVKVIYQIL